MSRSEYRNGYCRGYDFVAYEGGSPGKVFSELKCRGFIYRSPYGIGFMQGARDRSEGKPRRYLD